MIPSAGLPHACKLSTAYSVHNVTRAQLKDMEGLVASRFAALEEQMQRGRDDLVSKLEEVKSTLEEVKRGVDLSATSATQTRRVSRIRGNADALSAPIQRIRLAETRLDAIAQALNQSTGKEPEHRGELMNV